jgi:signal transduction histidine kinase
VKLVPETLGARLFALILLGLLATNLTVQALSGKGAGSMHQLGLDQILRRYASDFRVLAECTQGCSRERLIQAMAAEDFQLSLADGIPLHEMSEAEQALGLRLDQLIGLPGPAPAQIRILDPDSGVRRRHTPALEVSRRLPDGHGLIGTLQPVVRNGWWKPLGFSLLASGLPVLIVLALFLGRLLRPLHTLADAAERLSRGERTDPLPETGPRELRELSRVFNQMQARLTRFLDDRTHMLAAISHDFRTPITSLRLRAELVEDEALAKAMKRTLEEMRQMVDETLQFARDDSRQEDTRVVDLVPLLAHIAHDQQLHDHAVSTELPATCPYRCRPLALTRAVRNLVDNATRHGSHTTLNLCRNDQRIRIEVKDNGPGMPEEWLEKAFEPFTRLDSSRGPHSGAAGLGLAIARTAVEAHGGHIRLNNQAAGGLCASIELPA